MATLDRPPQLAPDLRRLLARLRRRIRRYVWVEGVSAMIAVLGLAFWLGVVVDWLFEPPVSMRWAGLLVAGVACLVVLYRLAIRRAFVRLSDRNMALLLERHFGRFEDSLLTAVELTDQPIDLPEFGREMLAHTCDHARLRAADVDVGKVFNAAPLTRTLTFAAIMALTVVAFALIAPEVFGFALDRLTGKTDDPWPRRTHLSIEGFAGHERVIARGSDLEILVKAEHKHETIVPQVVQIRYRTEEGKRDRVNMVREGNSVPGPDSFQEFKYNFQSVLSNVQFDVVGGDARVRDLRIRVVDSPAISMSLDCEYPAYMHRLPAKLPGAGLVPLPLGTRVTVNAHATKDLVRADVDYLLDKSTPTKHAIDVAGKRDFQFTLEFLDGDKTLSFRLLDTDGIQNRQPIPLLLSATPDEPPQVKVRLTGIGSAITPTARLPLIGQVTDDYGVAGAWVDFVVDEQSPRQQPLLDAPGGRIEVPVDEAFEVEPLNLKPGQKLLVAAKAADGHNLPGNDQPNIGQGERYLLDVVTPDELMVLLESRELNLRQRFETIIQEVTDTRDSLSQLEFPTTVGAVADPASGVPATTPAAADPGEEPAAADMNSPERVLGRRKLRIERAAQNGQKNAEETRGVAGSFDGIRDELVNNRVDTEELRIRLKDEIADPLRDIADRMFAEFGHRLSSLEKQVGDEAAARVAQQAAVEQADAILVRMQQVRDKMLELESFNEAIELLRQIIAAQHDLTEKTKKQRVEKVRNLLEDEE